MATKGILGHHLADERVEHILFGSPHTSLPSILSPHDALLYTTDQKARLSLLTAQPNPKDWDDLGCKTTSHFDSLFSSPSQASHVASSTAKTPQSQTPVRVHSKHKPPPAAPVPPQAANVPRLRIRKDLDMSPERIRDPRSRGEERRAPMNSYPPGAGAFAPMPGTVARRDTYPRFSGVSPPAPSIPSIHWP
jgi:hypothetical protein